MVTLKLTKPGTLLPVLLEQEISDEQAEEIGRLVLDTCHLPHWRRSDGVCEHPDHDVPCCAGGGATCDHEQEES